MVKIYDNMLRRFHLIPERHGQTDSLTDGLTDRQTDRQTDRFAMSLSVLRGSVVTRDKTYRSFRMAQFFNDRERPVMHISMLRQ